jgi:hypothetical protein
MQKEYADSSTTITGNSHLLALYIRSIHFLHMHSSPSCPCRLHAMMREKIGGELIRWNATRFGTVFMFLHSFWDMKDKFQAWMISSEWKDSDWKNDDDYLFTTDCLMNRL